MLIETCFDLRYAPEGMTDEEKVDMARECAAKDITALLMRKSEFRIDRENNCVRGTIRVGGDLDG